MPRKPIVRSNSQFYHVTARSNNKEFFYLPQEIVWNIFIKKLAELKNEFNIQIAAFVLMNNHFHLLFLTPTEDVDRIMYFLMKDTTLRIQKLSNRINRVYGGRYKGSLINNYSYLVNVYKYIYLNPVKAKITSKAEFYPFSTLFYKYHSSLELPFQLKEILPAHAFEKFEELDELSWINLNYNESENLSIKTGLSRPTFEYAKDNATGKRIIPVVRSPKRKTIEELWQEMFAEDYSNLLTF